MGDAVPKIYIDFPESFEVEELWQPNPTPGFVVYAYKITSNGPLFGKVIGIEGLNKTLIDVLVNIEFLNGEHIPFMLQPDKTHQIIPEKETLWGTVKTLFHPGCRTYFVGNRSFAVCVSLSPY